MSKIDEAILDHPALAKAIRGYGGRCRECADCEGICCNSGLPCDGGEARAAIEHVLRAVRYYSENPHFLDQIESDAALSAQPQSEAMATFEERGQLWSRWVGGSKAPSDWNGGRVLLASGEIVHPYQEDGEFDWRHGVSETGCLEPGCIVGYKSLSAQPQNEPPATTEEAIARVRAAKTGVAEDAAIGLLAEKREPQSEAGELTGPIRRLEYILEADGCERAHRLNHLTAHDLRTILSALRNQPAAGAKPSKGAKAMDDSAGNLRYIATILWANRDKFTVPDHIPAKVTQLKEAADEIKALRAERDWWQGAAKALAEREADYRHNHDVHGRGDMKTGRAWDLMRRQGDRIRARQALQGET